MQSAGTIDLRFDESEWGRRNDGWNENEWFPSADCSPPAFEELEIVVDALRHG